VANPLRSLAGDAAYVRDVITSIGGPVAFHYQFAADVPAEQAALMFATQRPVTQAALSTGLPTGQPAWKTIPSWFVFSDQDLIIPVALHHFVAERASARGVREIAGASHALSVSRPDAVAETILEAAK
jgi:pimeloyl-ACP methyl ester carboxylesterase